MLRRCSLFLLAFLLLSPANGFVVPNQCLKVSRSVYGGTFEDIGLEDAAVCVGAFLQHHQQLKRALPQAAAFFENIAHQGTAFILSNAAFTGASIPILAVILISTHCIIHANRQLMEAQFENDNLQILVETEIIPILKIFEKLLVEEGEEAVMNKLCRAKFVFEEMLNSAIYTLKRSRENVEKKLIESTGGEERSSIMQWLSGGGAAISGVAILLTPCSFTAFVACPPLMAGVAGLAGGGVGFLASWKVKLTHQQTIELLKQARMGAIEAEKGLRKARFNIQICIEHAIENPRLLEVD